ncbi:hypothetical protein Enr17x_15000 [Gimesia fumaroli]|uniref:Uncharacterized protein n=1 Tax=Gimesia fumaroli TaxID=2527976 RepID=A0A518I913_9PLAN|nr:hypothetical protein Enr17x_15000 [Gimesia fumaroli]
MDVIVLDHDVFACRHPRPGICRAHVDPIPIESRDFKPVNRDVISTDFNPKG